MSLTVARIERRAGRVYRSRDRSFEALVPLILPMALLALWHAAVVLEWVPSTLIATPLAVATDLVRLAVDGTLTEHIFASLRRLIAGFGIGAAGGLALGSWIGVSRGAQRSIEPTISVLAPIPPTAWIPLLIILFGIQEASKIWLIALGVLFVVTTNTVSGIRHVDLRFVEVARVCEKSRSETLWFVLLPAAMPAIMTGLRLGLGLSWILLIAAELIAANRGLGWFIYDARNFSRPDDMIAGMVCIGFLGAVSDRLMLYAQRHVLRWQSSYDGN
ncbi:sulfonate transport system permease protein [Novosphingobium sp. CF614]|uniref:ABC transporter permease n=1 Tax=Novosphingobium sp. CF614 TaxID=1884364 RepID=UPI0008F18E1F|nr:ABC transporter permease [Novosphingobium sp. CF614]SFG02106.1 sulfonate transport system permease protein [Novosphingobium sp. CF614]